MEDLSSTGSERCGLKRTLAKGHKAGVYLVPAWSLIPNEVALSCPYIISGFQGKSFSLLARWLGPNQGQICANQVVCCLFYREK